MRISCGEGRQHNRILFLNTVPIYTPLCLVHQIYIIIIIVNIRTSLNCFVSIIWSCFLTFSSMLEGFAPQTVLYFSLQSSHFIQRSLFYSNLYQSDFLCCFVVDFCSASFPVKAVWVEITKSYEIYSVIQSV